MYMVVRVTLSSSQNFITALHFDSYSAFLVHSLQSEMYVGAQYLLYSDVPVA